MFKTFHHHFKIYFPLNIIINSKNSRISKHGSQHNTTLMVLFPNVILIYLPPKKQLPSTYQLLPDNLRNYFPLKSPNSITPFRDILNKLRESYSFTKIPNDFFYTKTNLPNPNDINHPNFQFKLPITNPQEIPNLLTYLSKYFSFNTPLSKEWINLQLKNVSMENSQKSDLPPLPADFNIVNNTAETSFPISKPKDLLSNIRKAHQFYHFTRIPDNWISIPKKQVLTTMEETNKYLKNFNINISFPIKHNDNFLPTIKTLRQYFNFFKLPNQFIIFENQPEPKISSLFIH
jgi:hypothetical protein